MSELHGHAGAMGHVASQDFALYVIDGLAASQAAAVEDHVASCRACADALAREAQLELAMEMLAASPSSATRPAAFTSVAPVRAPSRPALVRGSSSGPPRGPHPSTALPARRVARVAGSVAASLAAAALVALWMAPGPRIDAGDDVARYGSVSADASGAMVSFDARPRGGDALDGG